MSFYLEGSKVRFATSLLWDWVPDWWEEVDHALGAVVIEAIN